jgi:GTPase
MFIDRVRVRVSGGNGGDGCLSFLREKYVPLGGPNGGDGGKGGDIIFVADTRMTSLMDLHYHSHWRGKRGTHGKGKDCHGRKAEDTIVHVPAGTVIHEYESNEVLCDLVEHDQAFSAARGGCGGRGNARLVTPSNRIPRFAEKGEPGEEREYFFELKTIAEVGLVGLPNAGKSTFLSRTTAANPKIADYPFTTLSPNLGMVTLEGCRTLSIADIPGIIEGAADGKGLGHEFLRHIERTKVLLFLIDLGDEDPRETYDILQKELYAHSEEFRKRPQFLAFNKVDVTEYREQVEALRESFSDCHVLSAATGEGVDELLEILWKQVEHLRKHPEEDIAPEPEREYTFQAPFTIKPVKSGFRVEGARVLRVVRMCHFENEEAVRHLQRTFQEIGLFKALKRMGAKEGQSIHIGDLELEYQDD